MQQDPTILEPGRTCWVVSPATSSGLLIDGEAYFSAFHAAASAARDSILLAGWQFDKTVSLLRGDQRQGVEGDVRLLPFLQGLCRANPRLQIRILCWDYSPAYMFQREWFQDFVFNRAAPGQLVFLFDDRHAIGASHHQKFAIIDGALAFLGSMDLCNARWDRREHPVECEERWEPYGEDVGGPFHEVQAHLTGPAVGQLQELFMARWQSAGGEPFEIAAPRVDLRVRLRSSIRLGPADVGFSRTAARTLVPDQPQILEIEQLYVDGIAAAQRSIYIESQYFGARAVHAALVQRLSQLSRPPLDVVIVCPRDLRSFTERVAMEDAQNAMFREVHAAAVRGGHHFGIYHVVSCADDMDRMTYIHSKVMVVDDRFLTVGSANLNNRSLGLDTELNVSWEAHHNRRDRALAAAIRRARVGLLAEHAGIAGKAALRRLYAPGFVRYLDELTRREPARLRPHPIPPAPAGRSSGPQSSVFDPDRPIEDLFERVAPSRREILAAGVQRVRRKLGSWRRRRRSRWVPVNRPRDFSRRPNPLWTNLVHVLRRWCVPLLLLAAVAWSIIALISGLL